MYRALIATLFALSLACLGLLWKVDNQSQKIQSLSGGLKTAKKAIIQYEENIEITERISNEHQNSINSLNLDIDRLRRAKPRCVTIARPPRLPAGSRPRGEHGQENGLRTEWLYEYAKEAERYRIDRNSCKDFVKETWQNRYNR